MPEHVSGRPWRGVYHHWDGGTDGLGAHRVKIVGTARGDIASCVRVLVDEAPWGWSSCFDAKIPRPSWAARLLSSLKAADAKDERYTEDDPGLPVSPAETGAVAFVYVFDVDGRRLDAFATHAGAAGARIGSVRFSATGEPDQPTLDLSPAEAIAEPPLPGPEPGPEDLMEMLKELPPLGDDTTTLQWVSAAAADDQSLAIVSCTMTWENASLSGVVEREWPLVPVAARREPERVRNFFAALEEWIGEDARRLDPFALASLDPLRRSRGRQKSTFLAQLRARG